MKRKLFNYRMLGLILRTLSDEKKPTPLVDFCDVGFIEFIISLCFRSHLCHGVFRIICRLL